MKQFSIISPRFPHWEYLIDSTPVTHYYLLLNINSVKFSKIGLSSHRGKSWFHFYLQLGTMKKQTGQVNLLFAQCCTVITYNAFVKHFQFFPGSVQFSCSVMSDSLKPHSLQHARPPCPSCTTGACSNSCSSSLWCHPTISSSVIPFSSCVQSCPASGSFQMSQFFSSGGQSIGVSASTSVLPMNIQDWFPLDGLVESPCSPRDSQESSPTPQFKSINSLVLSFLYSPNLTSIHDYWKNHSFD